MGTVGSERSGETLGAFGVRIIGHYTVLIEILPGLCRVCWRDVQVAEADN